MATLGNLGTVNTGGISWATPTKSVSSGISAGAGLTLLGGVLDLGSNIYGSYLQSKVYKANAGLLEAQGNYSSAVAEFNAAVARANAEAIRASADLDIERQKKAATALKSGQIAGYAKSGVKLEGSPINVLIDSAQQAKLDIAITDYNANIGVMQATSQAKGLDISAGFAKTIGKASGAMERAAGSYKQSQNINKGITSLLSTVSSYSR